MINKSGVKWLLKLALASLAIGASSNIWAACTQAAPGAKTVLNLKGVVACDAVAGRVGCDIANGSGSCTAYSGSTPMFTANSSINSDGSISWNITSGSQYNVDEVFVQGTTGGETCEYAYADEATAGQLLGFYKDNQTYQTVKNVSFCTDGKNQVKQVAKPLPGCPADVQAALNDGTIPGDYAIVGTITDGDSATLCLKSGVTVEPCINEEGKGLGTTPAGKVPRCSEGPNAAGSPSFKRNLTFSMNKTGENSQLFVCLPPTYTFGGGQSCGWVYY